jgi:hypothetical protein
MSSPFFTYRVKKADAAKGSTASWKPSGARSEESKKN